MTAPNAGAVKNAVIEAGYGRPEVKPPRARWRRWKITSVDENGHPLPSLQAQCVGTCTAVMNAEPCRPAVFVKKADTSAAAFAALCVNPAQLANMNEDDVVKAAVSFARSSRVEGHVRNTQDALDLLLAFRAGFVPRADSSGFSLSKLGQYMSSYETEPVEEEAA